MDLQEDDMKLIEGFKLRKIANDNILVPEGIKLVNFNKMIALNQTAAFLWESAAGKDFTPETLADMLLEHYDVSREQALEDCRKMVKTWIDAGIAEE